MGTIDLRPVLGRRSQRKSGARFLLVCLFDPAGITTIYENIALWQHFSRHAIEILNLWPGRGANLTIPATIDLDDYDGVIVHCAVSYHPDNLYSLDRNLARPFEEYDGLKILMKQDEHFHTAKFAAYIGKKRFDLVITCVSPEEREKAYPRRIVGGADFLQVFTGYVSPYMRSLSYEPAARRPLDVAYRGSIQPLSFGRLGFEKRKIGYDVDRVAAGHSLKTDISSRWEDRFGGTAWFDFLGRSRAVLGVESGANLFDFTGEVDAWCTEFIKSHPACDHSSEQFYNEAHQEFLYRFEGNVNYAQISPRHFEAAATQTAQILYEGHYSGVLIPNRHFLPLQRDLANFAEIADFVADDKRISDMAECAFDEIIQDRRYHYESFVASFDEAVDRVLERKGRRAAIPNARRALILMAHEPTADPRIEWMAEGLAAEFEVCELGMHAEPAEHAGPSFERLTGHRTRVRVGRRRHNWVATPDMATEPPLAMRELMRLQLLAELPTKVLERTVGALDATETDLFRFRWLARYFLHTNNALIQAGRLIGAVDVVVAADLETLPAALALAEECGGTVLYDSHEFWPYSDLEFRHWEVEFWLGFERRLARHADLRVTVSPPLAEMMSREYGCEFLSLPNCAAKSSVSRVDVEAALRRQMTRPETDFLFLGGFAAGRGIEDLIAAWRHVNERARLLLQGPDSPYKTQMVELARREGVLDNGVGFPPPVATNELVDAAREADIGIIPYAPSSINYRYCCPNKLSQYMAAGLPIVCNDTEFVKSVVVGNEIGICVDFRDHQALARAIDDLAASRQVIAEMSRRSHRLFEEEFNWESASRDLHARLGEIVRPKPMRGADLDFSWIAQGREMRLRADELEGAPIFADPAVKGRNIELAQQNEAYRAEMARLNETRAAEIVRLNAEIARLNETRAAEIVRLNAEIARLNETYAIEIDELKEEIDRLNESEVLHGSEIARLSEVYSAEIARLNEIYPAEIARLNEVYTANIARLSARRLRLPGLGRLRRAARRFSLRGRLGKQPEDSALPRLSTDGAAEEKGEATPPGTDATETSPAATALPPAAAEDAEAAAALDDLPAPRTPSSHLRAAATGAAATRHAAAAASDPEFRGTPSEPAPEAAAPPRPASSVPGAVIVPAPCPGPRVLMLSDDLQIDRRILHEAQTLSETGCDVIVLGRVGEGQPDHSIESGVKVERIDHHFLDTYRRMRQTVRDAFVGTTPPPSENLPDDLDADLNNWDLSLIERGLFYRPDILHVHDLPQLRAGCALKRALDVPLIYDAHEMYPEIRTLTPDQQVWLRNIENRYIRFADQVITVNPFIADMQAVRYGIARPAVILNATIVPPGFERGTRTDKLRSALGLRRDQKVLLFQGWVTLDRGLGDLAKGMGEVPENIHLALLGYGDEIAKVLEIAENSGAGQRVHAVPAVPQDELLFWVASADAGIIPYQPLDENYLFCSPNKLFEFIAAGTPVIANDLPYLHRVVAEEEYGVVRSFAGPKDYAEAIRSMFDEALGGPERFRPALLRTGARYLWPGQSPTLLEIYHRVAGWPERPAAAQSTRYDTAV